MTQEQTAERPSNWQAQIEGEWHGMPSIFDPQGNHVGFNKVYRSSVFEDGRTTYFMDTRMDAVGELRARFEARNFAFGVLDSDQDRIYMGPDFIGAGHPHGMLVDAHYYSPAWRSDLRTMVHILPDNETQVYSSLLYDGPTINGVFNGIYKVAYDYHTNPETKEWVDQFVASERVNGSKPHVLPMKHAGIWRGEMQVYDHRQQPVGTNQVEIIYRPLSLVRALMEVSISGVINRQYSFERSRNNYRHTFDGPDVYGNGMAYGRALYTSQHFYGEALKVRGREFIINDDYTMSAVWQFFASDRAQYMTFGVLNWEAGEDVMTAAYKNGRW